jgi:hypothetical protein
MVQKVQNKKDSMIVGQSTSEVPPMSGKGREALSWGLGPSFRPKTAKTHELGLTHQANIIL